MCFALLYMHVLHTYAIVYMRVVEIDRPRVWCRNREMRIVSVGNGQSSTVVASRVGREQIAQSN